MLTLIVNFNLSYLGIFASEVWKNEQLMSIINSGYFIISLRPWSLYPSKPFTLIHFTMRRPVPQNLFSQSVQLAQKFGTLLKRGFIRRLLAICAYSRVPNNSAARLLIFPNFSLPTQLIWTYTLIKFQIIFLPTRLLSTTFYFFISFLWFLLYLQCSTDYSLSLLPLPLHMLYKT